MAPKMVQEAPKPPQDGSRWPWNPLTMRAFLLPPRQLSWASFLDGQVGIWFRSAARKEESRGRVNRAAWGTEPDNLRTQLSQSTADRTCN
eukprot:1940938-Pyramimonas_sp.AAC.1